jgi:hypothetical protein
VVGVELMSSTTTTLGRAGWAVVITSQTTETSMPLARSPGARSASNPAAVASDGVPPSASIGFDGIQPALVLAPDRPQSTKVQLDMDGP